VAVAVDPFLLRSALHAVLAADPRFEVALCPAAVDPAACAETAGAQVLLTSEPVDAVHVCVVTLSITSEALQLTVDGERREVSGTSWASLCDWLAEELAGLRLRTAS